METKKLNAITINLSERELLIVRVAVQLEDNGDDAHLQVISDADYFMHYYFGEEQNIDDIPDTYLYDQFQEYKEEYGIENNPISAEEILTLQKKFTMERKKYPGKLIFHIPQLKNY